MLVYIIYLFMLYMCILLQITIKAYIFFERSWDGDERISCLLMSVFPSHLKWGTGAQRGSVTVGRTVSACTPSQAWAQAWPLWGLPAVHLPDDYRVVLDRGTKITLPFEQEKISRGISFLFSFSMCVKMPFTRVDLDSITESVNLNN